MSGKYVIYFPRAIIYFPRALFLSSLSLAINILKKTYILCLFKKSSRLGSNPPSSDLETDALPNGLPWVGWQFGFKLGVINSPSQWRLAAAPVRKSVVLSYATLRSKQPTSAQARRLASTDCRRPRSKQRDVTLSTTILRQKINFESHKAIQKT